MCLPSGHGGIRASSSEWVGRCWYIHEKLMQRTSSSRLNPPNEKYQRFRPKPTDLRSLCLWRSVLFPILVFVPTVADSVLQQRQVNKFCRVRSQSACCQLDERYRQRKRKTAQWCQSIVTGTNSWRKWMAHQDHHRSFTNKLTHKICVQQHTYAHMSSTWMPWYYVYKQACVLNILCEFCIRCTSVFNPVSMTSTPKLCEQKFVCKKYKPSGVHYSCMHASHVWPWITTK